MNDKRDRLIALKLWIWGSAFAVAAGWLLSAIHQLNIGGYLVFVLCAIAGMWAARKGRPLPFRQFDFKKSLRRLVRDLHFFRRALKGRRAFRVLYLVLAVLVFVSGLLYAPDNHMALTYRIPRVLHWLSDAHWSWVHAPDPRINDRACNNEWLLSVVLLFTRSDRALFLLNVIPFLFLPGLIFSTWTRLGVRPRVAWYWMWLFPTGYVFLTQAASISNDAFSAIYGLAAIDFALRAGRSGRMAELAHSTVAAALLTGSKGSNLALLLPWAVAIAGALTVFTGDGVPKIPGQGYGCQIVGSATLPGLLHFCRVTIEGFLQVMRKRTVGVISVVLLAASVSFLPTALLNIHYCGEWSGAKLETPGIAVKSRLVGIWGNALLLMKNFVPPFFPKAGWWNKAGLDVLPKAITSRMNATFERGYHGIGEIPTEEWAGLGFGLSVLLVVSVVAAPFCRKRMSKTTEYSLSGSSRGVEALSELRRHEQHNLEPHYSCRRRGWIHWVLVLSPWISLAAYAMNCGMVEAPRLIAPFYPLLLPPLLISSNQAVLVRKRWWQVFAFALALLALPVLIVQPARPLWPAKRILRGAVASHPHSQALARALAVYTVYRQRSDPLAHVRDLLPSDIKVVGFLGTEDDLPISLWKPYFHRRVENILVTDSADDIRRMGVRLIVVSGLQLAHHEISPDEWLRRVGGESVEKTSATLKVSDGPQTWYVVRVVK